MKKLLTGTIVAVMLSVSAQAAYASDVVAGVIGGILLGSIITNNNKTTVVTPPDIYVVQPSVVVQPPPPVVVQQPVIVQYTLCSRTVYVRPQGWTNIYYYCTVQ